MKQLPTSAWMRFIAARPIRHMLRTLIPAVVLSHVNVAQAADYYVTWNATDATNNINAKIAEAAAAGGSNRVILEYHSTPWYTSAPIELNYPNMEIWIKGGATVKPIWGNNGKVDGFAPNGACLFKVFADNVTMNGYANGVDLSAGRATLQMHKNAYFDPDNDEFYHPKADDNGARHCISIRGANHCVVKGFKLTQAGGDGICINNNPDDNLDRAFDIQVKDVICDDNWRQGMSIISGSSVTVTNCQFKNTGLTNIDNRGAPKAGLDLEPTLATDILKDITFTNCTFENNMGNDIEINLWNLDSGAYTSTVNVTFDGCLVSGGAKNGMAFLNSELAPAGTILFKNHTIQNMKKAGILALWAADPMQVTMSNVWVIDCGRDNSVSPTKWQSPILFGAAEGTSTGGFAFTNGCRIKENFTGRPSNADPMVWLNDAGRAYPAKDITGHIDVVRPATTTNQLKGLGSGQINCTLTVTDL